MHNDDKRKVVVANVSGADDAPPLPKPQTNIGQTVYNRRTFGKVLDHQEYDHGAEKQPQQMRPQARPSDFAP